LPSASAPAPSSSSSGSEWVPVRVCKECSKMPWLCKCNPAQRAHLLSAWGFGEEAPEEVHAGQEAPVQVESRLFQRFSECHGVWADAQKAEQATRVQRSRSRSRTPDPNEREAWPCPQCANLNNKHVLFCTTDICGVRRPLVHQWFTGDYFCEECGNHRFRGARFARGPIVI
jgi:hypothetical protein